MKHYCDCPICKPLFTLDTNERFTIEMPPRNGKSQSIAAMFRDYVNNDVKVAKNIYHNMYRPYYGANNCYIPAIKDVIFNPPATIVFWVDGTKTVVKAQCGDEFDPEKGLSMAISKKALGNQGNYYNTFAKWVPEEDPDEGLLYPSIPNELRVSYESAVEAVTKMTDRLKDMVEKRKELRE